MPDVSITDFERKVLSYCSRGVSKDTAEAKIALFFGVKATDVRPAIDKLKRSGLIIESTGVGVPVLTTSPLKVRSSMLDNQVIEQLTTNERSPKAAGYRKKTFDVNTGSLDKPVKKEIDLGFDLE